jgi:hypothetical protein
VGMIDWSRGGGNEVLTARWRAVRACARDRYDNAWH